MCVGEVGRATSGVEVGRTARGGLADVPLLPRRQTGVPAGRRAAAGGAGEARRAAPRRAGLRAGPPRAPGDEGLTHRLVFSDFHPCYFFSPDSMLDI